MEDLFKEIIQKMFDPTIGTAIVFIVIALGGLVVAGMAIYATILAVKALAKKC